MLHSDFSSSVALLFKLLSSGWYTHKKVYTWMVHMYIQEVNTSPSKTNISCPNTCPYDLRVQFHMRSNQWYIGPDTRSTGGFYDHDQLRWRPQDNVHCLLSLGCRVTGRTKILEVQKMHLPILRCCWCHHDFHTASPKLPRSKGDPLSACVAHCSYWVTYSFTGLGKSAHGSHAPSPVSVLL